jgi:adenylyltransferase/sulfurtransferase
LIIADRDVVDVSNLHRQVAHTAATVGTPKTASLAAAVAALNPGVGVECVGEGVTAANAVALARRSTVVLDCVDNAAARYLLSDAAAAAGVPLVSGAALGTDGQVTVFGAGGPCRRCVFPTPPPPAACGSCAEGGVLGPVPGVIGVLQALEAIKVVGGVGDGLAGRLLVFDGLASTARVVRLRPPSPACPACGPSRSIDVAATDYAAFVGAPAHDGPPPRVALLGADDRVAPTSLAARVEGGGGDVRVLDVRPAIQFALGRIPGSVNAPYGGGGAPFVDRARAALADSRSDATVVVVCRRGNDSQRAVVALREAGAVAGGAVDLEGGLEAWAAATAGFVRY